MKVLRRKTRVYHVSEFWKWIEVAPVLKMYLSNDVMGDGKCPWGDGELVGWPDSSWHQFAIRPSDHCPKDISHHPLHHLTNTSLRASCVRMRPYEQRAFPLSGRSSDFD